MNKTKELLKNLINTIFTQKGYSYQVLTYNYENDKWNYTKIGEDENDIIVAAISHCNKNDTLDYLLEFKSEIITSTNQYNFTLIKNGSDNYKIGYYDNVYHIWLCEYNGELENIIKELKRYLNEL